MELKQYLRVLVRKWWIIVLACVVTVASAVVFSEVRPPIYRSSAVLQVIPARYDYGLTLAAEQLLRQFANQIHTTNMAQQVIDELQLDITVDKFLAAVTVAPIPEDYPGSGPSCIFQAKRLRRLCTHGIQCGLL